MGMFGTSKTKALKDNVANAADLASALARDEKFRKQLLSGIRHGEVARRRARRRIGFFAAAQRLSADQKLRRELRKMVNSLDKAWTRVEKKRSHRVRNVLIVVGAGGAAVAAAMPQWRRALFGVAGRGTNPRTIEASIELGVPVSTAYNQWTQFEDFPLFMEGVDHVQQLDDTRLHWVATVAGKQAEWDAKILEQHPDRQISWISEDGKKTRGTVTFEPRGDSRTLIRLSMSYQAEGPVEALGSAAGLDERRVRGDLERFKELIESRGTETGAWRGEISAGTKTK
jgi:uncharacterized membrane protein